MRRESLFPFLPAVLAAVANIVATAIFRSSPPEDPGRFVVFHVVMLGRLYWRQSQTSGCGSQVSC